MSEETVDQIRPPAAQPVVAPVAALHLHAIEMSEGRCTWWPNCSTEAEALEAIAERSRSS